MSAVASAFSNFASMPAQQNETLDVVNIVDLALDIFNEEYIEFIHEQEEIVAKIDRTQLIRIITNLVKNAIQSIPDNQEEKSIKVTVIRKNEFVLIKVKDNGIGIDAENRERIFEPKFTTKTSGMGLGLGIIKNIIENYKGTINFETATDVGTVFTVALPILKDKKVKSA
jgi:signal transduction histidine kinase